MKKYLYLQLKRVLKIFPFVLAVTLILFTGLIIILDGIMKYNGNKEEHKVFNIAITGDTDNDYLALGITALQTFDQSRFSINFSEMSEKSAEKALGNGDISAYVVLPDDFINRALRGDVEPIKYVTTTGATDVIALFKNEVTKLITDIVVHSQKGAYGLSDAIVQNEVGQSVGKHTSNLSLEYVDLIIDRSELVEVKELGISGGLSMVQYYVCGILIAFIMLMGLPFAAMHIKKDNSLSKLLISKGYNSFVQLSCEFAVHLAALVILALTAITAIRVGGEVLDSSYIKLLAQIDVVRLAFYALPMVVLIAAFNIMIFEISSNIVGGVLLHFFSTLGLCYISGCFYPIYSFPLSVQRISAFLPVGIAREQLSTFFTDEPAFLKTVVIFVYAVVFFAAAYVIRMVKNTAYRGGQNNAKAV